MTTDTTTTKQPPSPAPRASEKAPGSAASALFPRLHTPLEPRQAVDALERLAKQGKLPGFERRGDASFSARVFGDPFDRDLVGEFSRSSGEGSELIATERLRPVMPIAFVAVILVTIWPGVWLTDSLLATYFPSSQQWLVKTWMWYLPLTVIPLPWAGASMWRKSKGVAAEHRAKLAGQIARAIGARGD